MPAEIMHPPPPSAVSALQARLRETRDRLRAWEQEVHSRDAAVTALMADTDPEAPEAQQAMGDLRAARDQIDLLRRRLRALEAQQADAARTDAAARLAELAPQAREAWRRLNHLVQTIMGQHKALTGLLEKVRTEDPARVYLEALHELMALAHRHNLPMPEGLPLNLNGLPLPETQAPLVPFRAGLGGSRASWFDESRPTRHQQAAAEARSAWNRAKYDHEKARHRAS
jgi:hypothetical protein